jgi:diaminopropionate ammonia-lyase
MLDYVKNPLRSHGAGAHRQAFGLDAARAVLAFHQSWPGYAATPAVSLSALSAHLGLGAVTVKDESGRFGLHAFKSLGGTYGLGRHLTRAWGLPDSAAYPALRDRAALEPPVTFVTATDGNHGVGISWAARTLGQRARVFMPAGSTPARVRAVEAAGGTVTVTDLPYDETVVLAAESAVRAGHVLAQDTVWGDRREMPLAIMQGYLTLAAEMFVEGREVSLPRPSHVILQAGVGSFAAAIMAFLAERFRADPPVFVVVEPTEAACFYASARRGDGRLVSTPGPFATVMAGLSCGVGNPLAWDILKELTDVFVRVDDPVSARGMRILGHPLAGDPRVVAGESGAVGLGLVSVVMEEGPDGNLRAALGLDAASRILVVNTEGATDPLRYRQIVWDGRFPWEP